METLDQLTDNKILKEQYIPTCEFYSQVIDCLEGYSIFTLDNELIINSWNSGATKIFGYETDEIIGNHFDIIFTEEDKKNGIPYVEVDTASNKGRAVDNRWHIRKDNSLFFAYGLMFPITGADNEKLGYVKILRDLSDRKKLDDDLKNYIHELEQLNAHKESILALVSQDVRSELAGIIGTAEYLRSNITAMGKDDIKTMLDLLHKSTVNELNLVDYLLEWSSIKYNLEEYTPQKIKLKQSVQQVIETLNESAEVNGLTLNNKIEEDATVFADEKMLFSILHNIILNAIKNSHQESEIIIQAQKRADKFIVEIRDKGIGISQKKQDKIFTPQLHAYTQARKNNKSLGIGLLLVKGFLEKNGGTIWLESEEGKGSAFYFSLPMDKVPQKIKSKDRIVFDKNE